MTQVSVQPSGVRSVRTGQRGAPLVVLIHAVGVDLTYWGDQIEMLQPSYDVVAYDLPGHGGSAKPAKGFGFSDAVATLTQVIADAAAARAIAERIPGSVLHIVPDASHMAPLEKPLQVNDILRGFLAAH